jgi:hypothetical protein
MIKGRVPVAGNGNGVMQGWIRLALTIGSMVAAMFWAVAEIKSDIREVDARLTGRINGIVQHLDDLNVSAQREHESFREKDRELSEAIRKLDWNRSPGEGNAENH